ncbi:MAG: hypothetical protein SGPRY_000241 [Prymnesium sp.]
MRQMKREVRGATIWWLRTMMLFVAEERGYATKLSRLHVMVTIRVEIEEAFIFRRTQCPNWLAQGRRRGSQHELRLRAIGAHGRKGSAAAILVNRRRRTRSQRVLVWLMKLSSIRLAAA